jgi:tetratricopeptide (TPR) repeat protein
MTLAFQLSWLLHWLPRIKLKPFRCCRSSTTRIPLTLLSAACWPRCWPMRDYAGSDHLYAALLAKSPNDAALLLGHGQNLVRLLRYPEAFAAFSRATEIDPANGDGWSGVAFTASRTNQPAITLHALTMRSKYLDEVPSTYFLWATAYDSLHQKSQAATYYQRFLESSAGKFPDQEWQARQRLKLLKENP